MNIEKIKKIFKRIAVELVFIIAIAFTAVIITGKVRDSRASELIRDELRIQREENSKLEEQIDSLSGEYSKLIERSRELELIEQRLEETSKRLQIIQREYENNNIRNEEDITELDRIQQQDREAVSRLRELLQKEDTEDSND